MWGRLSVLVAVLGVAFYAYDFLGYRTVLVLTDQNCELVNADAMPASEDFAPIGDGRFFISVRNVHQVVLPRSSPRYIS